MLFKSFLAMVGGAVVMMAGTLQAQPSGPEMDPIPQDPQAFLEKDHRAKVHAWQKRKLLEPAKQRWAGQPWADEATALVEEMFSQEALEGFNVTDFSAPLAARFRALAEKAGNDPLIQALAAESLYEERLNWRDSAKVLERALNLAGQAPAALEQRVIQTAMTQTSRRGYKTKELKARLLEATTRAVADGSFDAEDDAVFLRYQMQGVDVADTQNPDDLVRWQKAVADSPWSEWVKLTLEGHGEVELAWLKRSSGWANTVSREQWRGFAEHLKVARDVLGRAYRLSPRRPEAASQMIRVCMGEDVDLSETRSWFDRAVSAQFDYMSAYQALLWVYRPRWGGSHELMLAFGKACAKTKRYDTGVPSRLMAACLDVTSEVRNPVVVFRHDLVKEALSTLSKGYLDQQGTPPHTHAMRVSNAVMCSWLADDDVTAARGLKAAGDKMHPAAVAYLNGMMMHEKMLRSEVAADVGDYGEAVKAIANPAPGTSLPQMIEAFAKIDTKDLSEDAKSYVKDGYDMLSFEKSLEPGEWVPLKPQKYLSSFYMTGGQWTVEDDGTLVATGDDTFWTKLMFRPFSKSDLEMRCDIEFDIPKETEINASSWGFGPALRWMPETSDQDEGGVRFTTFTHKDGYVCAQAYNGDADKGSPDRTVKLQPVNKFSARMAEGLVSFDLNDRSIASRFAMKKMGAVNEGGFLGFTSYRLPWGGKVKIRNIEVRKITGKDLAPQAKKSADPAPAHRSTTGPEPTPLWKNKGFQAALMGGLIVIALLMQRFMKSRE